MPRLRDEPRDAPEYYEYMGRATAIWGRLEHNFTTDLWFMASIPDLVDIFRTFPRGWEWKLRTFSKCFSLIPELRVYEEAASRFVTEAMQVALDRNVISHGSFWAFTNDDPLTAEFTLGRVDKKTRNLSFTKYHCTLHEMKEIVIKTDNLNTHYVSLSFAVGQICNELKMKKPQSPSV
jgi:hypothetical protein